MKSPALRGEIVAVHRDAGQVTIQLDDPRAIIWFECGDPTRTSVHGLTAASVRETKGAVRKIRRAYRELTK